MNIKQLSSVEMHFQSYCVAVKDNSKEVEQSNCFHFGSDLIVFIWLPF